MLALHRKCDSNCLFVSALVADNKDVDVDRLRAETRPEHEATEATLPLMSADLTLSQYVNALQSLGSVLSGWEAWATKHAPEAYCDLLAARRRSLLIQADLKNLSAAPISSGSIEEQLTAVFLAGEATSALSPARFLGAMYVVEGSTLGGQYIAKHVEEKFGFADGNGNTYFRGYGEHTGSMWRSFKDELIALPETDADEVIAAARSMFGIFAEAMHERESIS